MLTLPLYWREMHARLVTGGALGLGKEIASHLADEEEALVIHYRSHEKEALQLVEELKNKGCLATALYGDFSTHQGVEEFIAKYLDNFDATLALVNNVGPWLSNGSVLQGQELFQTNFFAPYRLMEALSAHLKSVKGSIVNIGICGLHDEKGHPDTLFYFAAKRSLLEATRSFAKKLAPGGVRVNMVSLGYTDHSIMEPTRPIPIGSKTSAEEAARLISYLLSPQNETLTGQNIDLDGGISL